VGNVSLLPATIILIINDVAAQLVKVTDWSERVTSYTYDKNGRLKTVTRPNGIKTTRVYNRLGQLVRQYDRVNSFEFSYDAAGNIVTEKTEPEADPNINLEMAYQAANRLATVDDFVIQFDADGNMTRGPLVGELTNFGFDSRNRLVQAGDTNYHYDAENQRIGINQIQYVVNSQPALSQVLVKEDNGQKTFYVYGLGLIGQESNGEYLNYHFDFRGSTVALTDETAQVVERFQYSPYGVLLSGSASITPFLFNGMYGVMSDGNGLYYMRARFYSPEIRRFVNQDILLGGITDGQTLNRYAYVTGRPVSYVDPFGLEGIALGDDIYGTTPNSGLATAVVIITASTIPGVGEGLDLQMLISSSSTGWDRLGAGSSLVLSIVTLGTSPNYSTLEKCADEISGKPKSFWDHVAELNNVFDFEEFKFAHEGLRKEKFSHYSTEGILKTLFEGDEPLLVGKDGVVWKGNERLAILIDRAYDMEEIKKRLTQRNLYKRTEAEDIAPWEKE